MIVNTTLPPAHVQLCRDQQWIPSLVLVLVSATGHGGCDAHLEAAVGRDTTDVVQCHAEGGCHVLQARHLYSVTTHLVGTVRWLYEDDVCVPGHCSGMYSRQHVL